jgi:hypothetical protein
VSVIITVVTLLAALGIMRAALAYDAQQRHEDNQPGSALENLACRALAVRVRR